MSEYYAVQRSDDSLKHYGVRGMKWGVRKAIKSGNVKRLSKQYNKAAKKLAKLNAKTDIKTQTAKANKYNKIAKRAGKVGIAGAGTLAGLHLGKDVNNVLSRIYGRHSLNASKTYSEQLASTAVGSTTARKKALNLADKYESAQRKAAERAGKFEDSIGTTNSRGIVGMAARAAAVGGLGTAAVAKSKAIAAKRRTTAKGHAKAVAKRDAYRKEMQTAFKGTKYAKLPSIPANNNRHGKKRKRA